MQESFIPHTREQIIAECKRAFDRVENSARQLSEAAYRQRPGNKWSPAEQLEHLILSTQPVVAILGKDRQWFLQFGAGQHPGKDYTSLKAYYLQVLSTGLKAPAKFTPSEEVTMDKAQQLETWTRVGRGLLAGLADWSESDLDDASMPHPALGILSMRQMLFFTILHTYHHGRAIAAQVPA